MNPRRIYRQYCMMARALELIGERWSLLIVRDLLLGPRRFTDLVRGLSEITPTRLTSRLRQLESAGIVAREPPAAGREVWYRLTEAGFDLRPVVDALTIWGIEHALETPLPDEPVHPTPAMIGTKAFLVGNAVRPSRSLTWVWSFPADERYTLRFDGHDWTLARTSADPADVIVETTPETWMRFLTARVSRKLPRAGITLVGEPGAIADLVGAFRAQSS